MPGINKIIIIGRLGQAPETKILPNGDTVCNFSVATSDTWKDKTTGEKRERTEWHRVTAFRKLGEICGKYLEKGKLVYIEGKVQTRDYEKDGQKHYVTEVIASDMQMLGGKSDGAAGGGGGQSQGQALQNYACDNRHDEDIIPF